MNNRAADIPLTEPKTVECLYVTEVGVEIGRHVVRFVGSVDMPDLGGETSERRIVVRFTMDRDGSWRLRDDLVKMLRRDER